MGLRAYGLMGLWAYGLMGALPWIKKDLLPSGFHFAEKFNTFNKMDMNESAIDIEAIGLPVTTHELDGLSSRGNSRGQVR